MNTARIKITRGPVSQIAYVSGPAVYTEQFAAGKLAGQCWSANAHIPGNVEAKNFGPDVPSQAFALNLDGQSLDWGWTLELAEETDCQNGRRAKLGLAHTVRPVRVTVHTEVDGTGFFSRWLEITNTAARPAALSTLDVFAGILLGEPDLRASDFETTPFELGRFAGNRGREEGRFVWQPLTNGVVAGLYSAGPYGTSGYNHPYFIIRSTKSPDCFVFYLGYSGPWNAAIVCDTTLRKILHARLGPAAPAPLRVVQPGETIVTPRVHFGHLQTDLDGCVQAAHEHIRRTVIPRSPRMPRPLLSQNSWGLGGNTLTEEVILRDIELAHELGCELYTVDAGWFGRDRNNVEYGCYSGDWTPGPWFPRGFDPIVAKLREKGMLFGLWIEPENLGAGSAIAKAHPDWLVQREGATVPPLYDHLTLDFTKPAAAAWLESELERVVRDYHLDLLRLDGCPVSAYIGDRLESGYSENTVWRHYECLDGILDRLRQKFPDLIIENCCGGGGRLDLGMLARTHRTQITDVMRPPRSIQIINGISLMLPPEFCMIYPFAAWENANLDFIYRVPLFGGFYNMGWLARREDLHPGLLATAKRYTGLHKRFVAPLLPGCRVYHHTPVVRVEGDVTPYCVLEYTAANRETSMVGIFKLTDGPEPYRLFPKGLDAGRKYRVTFDNDGTTAELDGLTLRQQGLPIQLTAALTSELLLFQVC
ncbi:MAG: hypothetical protein PCFJNLEI_02455 [Verrucomicrobiae bacterium]|nr:hypothetical protein [Verrucomicrobiae bacterium]